MKNQRGLTLTEVVIAVAVFTIVILGAVQGFLSLSKSFMHSKVKNQALQFANDELENFQKIARIPERDSAGNVPPSPKPIGFTNFVVGDGAETLETYPRSFFSEGASAANEERLQLFRKVEVSTVNVNTLAEYRVVKVTLRDSISPSRFSPISVETIIKKPSPDALDIRSAMGVINISGTFLDEDSGGGIPTAVVTIGTGTFMRETNTNDAGNYGFHNYIASQVQKYTITATREGYWPAEIEDISLAGQNDLTINGTMQTVYITTVNINVQDLLGGLSPIQGAAVEISYRAGVPPTVPAPLVNSATYTGFTGADGNATFNIPIPVTSHDTHAGYYVKKISKTDYFSIMPDHDITLDKNSVLTVNFNLVAKKYGNYTVNVKDTSSNSLQYTHVELLDFETNQVLRIGSNDENFARGSTDINGIITFNNIAVNSTSDPNATERKIKLNIQILGYQRILAKQESSAIGSNTRVATADQTVSVTKNLDSNTWKGTFGTAILDEEQSLNATDGIDISLARGATTQLSIWMNYKGHGINPSDFNLPGLGFIKSNEEWGVDGSGIYGIYFRALDLPVGSITNLSRKVTYTISNAEGGLSDIETIGCLKPSFTSEKRGTSIETDATEYPYYCTPQNAVQVNLTITPYLQFDYTPLAGADPYGPQTLPFSATYTSPIGNMLLQITGGDSFTTFINGGSTIKAGTTIYERVATKLNGVLLDSTQYDESSIATDPDGGLASHSIVTNPTTSPANNEYWVAPTATEKLGAKFSIKGIAEYPKNVDPPTYSTTYTRSWTVVPNMTVSIAPAATPISMGFSSSQVFTATISGPGITTANLHWQALDKDGIELQPDNDICSISPTGNSLTTTLKTSSNIGGTVQLRAFLAMNGYIEYSNIVAINVTATGASTKL